MKLPPVLVSVRNGMETFGLDIATLVNSILLSIVYVVGVGLTAIVARIFRKKFLNITPSGKTYWKDTDTKLDEDSFYKQF